MSQGALKIQTAEVFLPFLRPFGELRYKGAYGGRGSGKSHHFGESVVERAAINRDARIVGIRETQRSLKSSSKLLIEDKIRGFQLGYMFDIKDDRIVILNRARKGAGIILFEGMQSHTAESIKSLEGFEVSWADEAQALSHRSLMMLRPTIRSTPRAPVVEQWYSWNPRLKNDPVDRFFRGPQPPKNGVSVRVNWSDNPFFPQELLQDMADDRRRDPELAAHVWDGAYLSDHENQVIAYAWLLDARDRDIDPDGSDPKLRISVDVADGGADKTVITVGRHYQSFSEILLQQSFTFPSAKAPIMAANEAEKIFNRMGGRREIDDFVVDGLGVGAGTAGTLIERGLNVVRYVGGGRSSDPALYRNRRVECMLTMRDRFRDGTICLNYRFIEDAADWDEFLDQVTAIRRVPGIGRVEDVETKEAIKKREGISPDRCDSLMMQFDGETPVRPMGDVEVMGYGYAYERSMDGRIAH